MPEGTPTEVNYARRHMQFGWWSLLLFTTGGLGLELLHGFKVRAYLDVSNETRRLMWTLGHAHGGLLAVLHMLFAVTVRAFPEIDLRTERLASRCLILASILLPGGFVVGGVAVYGGDPGLGILIVPIGAAFLLVAIFALARAAAGIGSPPETGKSGAHESAVSKRARV